jgi:hypothetical protein
MVKVACFQATALDAHVVVVVGSECLCHLPLFQAKNNLGVRDMQKLPDSDANPWNPRAIIKESLTKS